VSDSTDILVLSPDRLQYCGTVYRCVLGRSGVRAAKSEGDGATPVGRFPLRRVFYRPDRLENVSTGLPIQALRSDDGWCDDSAHARYNHLIKRPFPGNHEILWRDDAVYDVIVELGYNDDPPAPGKGSAIFMHVARPDYAPTEGCVALRQQDLLAILSRCTQRTFIAINPPA